MGPSGDDTSSHSLQQFMLRFFMVHVFLKPTWWQDCLSSGLSSRTFSPGRSLRSSFCISSHVPLAHLPAKPNSHHTCWRDVARWQRALLEKYYSMSVTARFGTTWLHFDANAFFLNIASNWVSDSLKQVQLGCKQHFGMHVQAYSPFYTPAPSVLTLDT